MKRLTCEMCGGTDLVKDGGVFVCQSCGCKYSVEEAKRMMIEGTVDIQGTVTVDNSAFVQKYLENARRAKEKEDWEETEKYYNLVEQNDPKNIEAIFYSAYGKARASLIDADIFKRKAAFQVLTNCISIIDDNYQIDRREENEVAINNMADDLAKLISSNFVYTKRESAYSTSDNKAETYELFQTLLNAFKDSIDNIMKVDDQPFLHDASLRLYRVANNAQIGGWTWSIFKIGLKAWIEQESSALKKSCDAFWEEHAEERTALVAEREEIRAQMIELVSKVTSLPETAALDDIRKQLEAKQNEKKALGIFQVKEKQAVQAQIDLLTTRWKEAKKAYDTAASPDVEAHAKLKARFTEIEEKLSKGKL